MLRQEEKDNGSADYYKTLKNRARAPGECEWKRGKSQGQKLERNGKEGR